MSNIEEIILALYKQDKTVAEIQAILAKDYQIIIIPSAIAYSIERFKKKDFGISFLEYYLKNNQN